MTRQVDDMAGAPGAVPERTLEEMRAYYRARAAEYDEWWERRGRYDEGPEANARWFREAEEVYAALQALDMRGDVLELAPGTGIWTERLARTASTVTAVDASPEMIEINQARVGGENVSYALADLFVWAPDRQYDGVLFGFWLSHVPEERLDAFFGTASRALKPGGKLFFVDSWRGTSGRRRSEANPQVIVRTLNDGREFEIVKNLHEPEALAVRCAEAGLAVAVRHTPTYFLYGVGEREA